MSNTNPTIEWYSKVSENKGLLPRCPFRSVYRCPRYYLSLSLLGEAGSTKIAETEDKKLLEMWRKSDLWPTTQEDKPGIMQADGETRSFDTFCPEVLFDRFGYFATHLWRYPGEEDTERMHVSLASEKAPREDWRWYWGGLTPMHFSECPLYSPLMHKSTPDTSEFHISTSNENIIDITPSIYGITLNPKALLTRLSKWWLSKHS